MLIKIVLSNINKFMYHFIHFFYKKMYKVMSTMVIPYFVLKHNLNQQSNVTNWCNSIITNDLKPPYHIALSFYVVTL